MPFLTRGGNETETRIRLIDLEVYHGFETKSISSVL